MKNQKKYRVVKTCKAPKALGPYSQAVIAGGFIFCSGQIGIKGYIAEQTKQAIENLENILIGGDSGLDHIVKTEVYLKDMNDFEKMNEVYSKYLLNPARVTVEVSKLPKDALVEISCIALLKKN